jgi:hypothetical protein
MATNGLIAVTAIGTGALALGAATNEEYRAGYVASRRLFAERVSHDLGHSYVAIDVARYEDRSPKPRPDSFERFYRSYRPPEAIYVCPACGGDALTEDQQEPDQFRRSGGQLILVDGLSLDRG